MSGRNLKAVAVAIPLLMGGFISQQADADERRVRPRQQRQRVQRRQGVEQRLNDLVRANNLKTHQRGNKLYLATTGQLDVAKYTNLGPNVVEFFVRPGFHHLYTRIGDQVFSRIHGLSKSGYRRGSSEQIGVLVEFKDSEMARLNDYLERSRANPSQMLGPFNYNGGRPPHQSNCTSYITYAEIGDRGQTLGAVLGSGPSGYPPGFLRSLMRSNNERIKGIVVHNPKAGQAFDTDYVINPD